MKTHHLSIYTFICSALLLLSTACTTITPNKTNVAQELPQLSVQLWSVKDELNKDYKGTLKALANMGFEGVEFAGLFGEFSDDPTSLKQYLNSLGLKVSGAHISFDQLNEKNFEKTVKFYKALECSALIVSYDERAWHPKQVVNVARELNALSEQLAPHNMRIGFHNHQHEFNTYNEATYWDYLVRTTADSVIMQLDVGWSNFAGKDPVEYVKRYPGRTFSTHYKAMFPEDVKGKLPIIGLDTINWSALIKANIEVGGTQWIVLEQEEYPNNLTSLEAVLESKKGLDQYFGTFGLQSN